MRVKTALGRCVPRCCAVWLGLAGLAGIEDLTVAQAQLPVARLTSVFPLGMARSSSVEVTVTGQDLDGLKGLHFSHPGLTSVPKPDPSNPDANVMRFVVTARADVPVGVHDLRTIGRFGISNPRGFQIGGLAEAIRGSTNHTLGDAQVMSVNQVVNGRCEPNAGDYYTFKASQGQTFVVTPHTRVLDSKLDPVVVLYDGKRREMLRSRAGMPLAYRATEEGMFFAEIRDSTYRGGEDFGYRLEVASGPVMVSVYPPVVAPGAEAKLTVMGWNLPGANPSTWGRPRQAPLGESTTSFTMPGAESSFSAQLVPIPTTIADAGSAGVSVLLPLAQGSEGVLSTRLMAAIGPVVSEASENNTVQAAQRLEVPSEWVGRFYPTGDVDWAYFEVKKGETYWVEVWSQRLGCPTDAMLVAQHVVKDAKGLEQVRETWESNDQDTNIGGREFRSSSNDPVLKLEPKEDGVVRLQLRDLFNVGSPEPSLVYRVTVSKTSPDFALVVTPLAPPPVKSDSRGIVPWSTLVRGEGTTPVSVLLLRRQGFTGEVEVTVEGLPDGLRAHPCKIEGGKSSGVLLFTAGRITNSWAGPVRLVGKARIGDRDLLRRALSGTVAWTVADYNNDPVVSRLCHDMVLAVSGTEAAPVTVRVSTNAPLEVVEGGKLSVPLEVKRSADWTGALKLKAQASVALEGLKELEVDGKATQAVLNLDLSQQKLAVGVHLFFLQGSTQGKYRNHPELAKAAEDRVKELEKGSTETAKLLKDAKENLAKASKDNAAEVQKLEQQVRDLEAQAKTVEAAKEVSRKYAKEIADKSQPRDVTMMVYSEPISVHVTAVKK